MSIAYFRFPEVYSGLPLTDHLNRDSMAQAACLEQLGHLGCR